MKENCTEKLSNSPFLNITFALCHRPSVCLSSVCNVRAPY